MISNVLAAVGAVLSVLVAACSRSQTGPAPPSSVAAAAASEPTLPAVAPAADDAIDAALPPYDPRPRALKNLVPVDDPDAGNAAPTGLVPDCEQQLSRVGVTFRAATLPVHASKPGSHVMCGAPQVLTYLRGPTGVTYEPAPLLTCAMALSLASFERILQDEADREFHSSVTRVQQIGTYNCREIVAVRGLPTNTRIKNQLVPGIEGGVTRHLPDGQQMSVFDAAMKYQSEGVPLIVLAGKEYGSGSSRDWAAKGPRLLGVGAVIAESYERIHRSNLVGMGVVPLQFLPGENPASLGLSGEELFDVEGLAAGVANGFAAGKQIGVKARGADGGQRSFRATVRIDTPQEVLYYQHGGILQFVLRQLVGVK